MTEPLFVCEMIWAVVWLVEWRAELGRPIRSAAARAQCCVAIAAVLVAAMLTRYDGWVMALLAWVGIGMTLLAARRTALAELLVASVLVVARAASPGSSTTRRGFGDWLDFARGPYSAKAIEMRTAVPGLARRIRAGTIRGSRCCSLSRWRRWTPQRRRGATAPGAQRASARHGAGSRARRARFAWTLLLWLPVPFYAYSVAYGSVPIFIPAVVAALLVQHALWPGAAAGIRAGTGLCRRISCSAAVREFKPQWATIRDCGAVCALIALNAWAVLRERPLVYVEGTKNIDARRPFEQNIPPVLRALLAERPGGAVLMNTSVYPELVALTGIPLRQTINESDKEFYRDALAAPACACGAGAGLRRRPCRRALSRTIQRGSKWRALRRQASPPLRFTYPIPPASDPKLNKPAQR